VSNFYAFLLGVWTLAWVMAIHEGAMPFVGYLIFGLIYVLGILVWVATYREERNAQ
jgi:hypothetical protein